MSDSEDIEMASTEEVKNVGGHSDETTTSRKAKGKNRKQKKPSDGLTAFQRAKKQYERIQDQKREDAKKRKADQERQEKEKLDALSFRRRKDQAMKSRTRKGQPNLNAVMGCIVEKLMKEKEKKK